MLQPSFCKRCQAFILASLLCSVVVHAQQETAPADIDNQSATMGRVFRDALDHAGLGEWEGGANPVMTPFNRGVFSEYVPTIGVMLNIHVSFPISAPGSVVANEAVHDSEPADLWEKHLRPRMSRGTEFERTIETEDVKGQIAVLQEDVFGVDLSTPGVSGMGRGGLEDGGGMGLTTMFGQEQLPEFDKERVENLRIAILDTLSKYGHRITGLPEGERVVIIVHAPKSPGSDVQISPLGKQDGAASNEQRRVVIKLIGQGLRKSERMLFSVPKPAIAAETNRDVLTEKIIEKRY